MFQHMMRKPAPSSASVSWKFCELLGEGKTNREIAKALFRSPHTIKLHVSAILQQLKLKSRTQAALLASKIYKQDSDDPVRTGVEAWKKAKKASTAPARRK